ncbi:hypothetical protein [Methylomonas rapida]|uniref:Terminase small subunit n=1 Tax=Methylomonas rapida TaxID=2963939 RepID=A0ABY7GR08_9GAMM|nr:hypothetical protein [Methylomonas rapida]WAR46956.1 hypothetical protein NM686_010715 [Methylomonas rapida]
MVLLTQADYARQRGVSKVAVHKAIKSGRISLIDGKIDPEVADIQWERNTDKVKQAAANSGRMRDAENNQIATLLAQSSPVVEDYMHWKTRRERAEAIRSEQDQEREAGNLIYRDQAERGAKTVARLLRDQLLSVPSRLAAELSAITETTIIEQKIRDEIRTVLSGMDKLIQQYAEGVDDEA